MSYQIDHIQRMYKQGEYSLRAAIMCLDALGVTEAQAIALLL
jgi:hypothetical protein